MPSGKDEGDQSCPLVRMKEIKDLVRMKEIRCPLVRMKEIRDAL